MTEPTTAAAKAPPNRLATVAEVAAEFRRRLDLTGGMSEASALYREGLAVAWRLLIGIAADHTLYARDSERDALLNLHDRVVGAEHRIKGTTVRAPSPAAHPEMRQGREDAYRAAVLICSRAVDAAERSAREAAARDAARSRLTDEGEIRDWNGYPLVPMSGDEEIGDLAKLALFLGGEGTSFTGDLLRLIGKADPENLNRLALAYPRHVRAFLMWRACAPVPVRTLVALLNTTTLITGRNL